MLITADYLIIIAYFIVTMGIGFWSARKAKKSSKGFFVAESSLPWWVVGFTMIAAGINAEQMLGQIAYSKDMGLVVSNWDLAVYPSLLLMIFVFLPVYLRNGITTIPEYLEKRYNRTTRLIFAGYTVFNNAFITLAMVIALGATAMKYFLGWDPILGAGLLTFFTGIYTVYGGMSSVAWTDTFQCMLLLAGGITVFGYGIAQVPGGWEGLMNRMPDPHLVRGLDDNVMPWTGLILLALSTNVWYCCTNQFYVQSCLGAKNHWHGRMGVLLTALLGPFMTLCFAFPGYIAGDLISQDLLPALPVVNGVTDANATYPHLVKHFLGPGLRGFLVAAVLGAIMSTISSIVNATASVFTMDLYQRWLRPNSSERNLVLVGRMSGFGALLIAFPLSLLVSKYDYIFVYSQNAWCILAIPIMLVFTMGVLSSRANSLAANTTFLFVTPFVAVPFLLKGESRLTLPIIGAEMHLFTFAFWLWIASAAFMWIVSLSSRAPDPVAIAPYLYRPRLASLADKVLLPWYKRIGFWSAVGAAMYAIVYMTYW